MDTINLNEILSTHKDGIDEIVSAVLSDMDFDVKTEIIDKLPYMRKAGINDIVPMEYQNKLMAIDFTMSQCYWMIGDIANDLINSVNRERSFGLGKLVSQQDIFEAVGFFCHRTARTVNYYWNVARYFPIEVRQKHDVPFSMYADARWVEDWELYLRISDENPMFSASRVRAEYYRLIGKEEPKDEKIASAVPDFGAELPLPEEGEKWTGNAQVRFNATVLDNLEHTVDNLRGVLDKIPLPTEIRERIMDIILEINDISMTIRRES
jgi:hypothetical protein